MTVKCIPRDTLKDPCPILPYCLARLADQSITGCGVPLYIAGLIRKSEILVERTFKEEKRNDSIQM